MDKFLAAYRPPKLNQEEIGNLNRLMSRSEIESVIIIIKKKKKTSLQTKAQDQMPSQVNATKHTKKNLY